MDFIRKLDVVRVVTDRHEATFKVSVEDEGGLRIMEEPADLQPYGVDVVFDGCTYKFGNGEKAEEFLSACRRFIHELEILEVGIRKCAAETYDYHCVDGLTLDMKYNHEHILVVFDALTNVMVIGNVTRAPSTFKQALESILVKNHRLEKRMTDDVHSSLHYMMRNI